MTSRSSHFRVIGVLCQEHDGVIKWKHFPRYFMRGIHRSPVNSPHKGQWHWALMFSLICVWKKQQQLSKNIRYAGDLRRHISHYDVTVMVIVLVAYSLEGSTMCNHSLLCTWTFRWLDSRFASGIKGHKTLSFAITLTNPFYIHMHQNTDLLLKAVWDNIYSVPSRTDIFPLWAKCANNMPTIWIRLVKNKMRGCVRIVLKFTLM